MKIIDNPRCKLNPHEFISVERPKNQIILHHTVGGGNPFNVANWWNTQSGRIGTAFVIAGHEDTTKAYKDGDIFRLFDEKFYAWHVNARIRNAERIEMQSIGIEICNYGALQRRPNGTYFALISKNPLRVVNIPTDQVVDVGFDFRGTRYYHKYTDKQLKSLTDLLAFLCKEYEIPTNYNNLFIPSKAATDGARGIWGHCNFRADKSDVSPQPILIDVLQTFGQLQRELRKEEIDEIIKSK